MSSYRYAVIGGGIAGLTAALELAKAAGGANVVLIEATGRLGGMVSTERRGGYVIERGPDGVLARKPETLELIRELDIEDRVIGRRADHPGAYLRTASGLQRFPAGLTGMVPLDLDSLRESSILSARGIARVEREPSVGAPPTSGDIDSGDESVASFFSRRFGGELFERLVAPLVSGIYAGSGEELSMRALFPQLLELEWEYGSVIRGMRARATHGRTGAASPVGSGHPHGRVPHAGSGRAGDDETRVGRSERSPSSAFISLAGGMGELVEACRRELLRLGVTIRTGCDVRSIVPATAGEYRITHPRASLRRHDRVEVPGNEPPADGADSRYEIRAAKVVAAVPAAPLAGILGTSLGEEPPSDDLLRTLRRFDARSAALVTFALPAGALERFPNGAGYVVSDRATDLDPDSACDGQGGGDARSHSLLACTIASRKWPGRAPAERELIRFFFRRHRDGAVDALERSRLVEHALAELSDVLERADPAGDASTGSAGRGGGDSADPAERFRTEHHSVEPELSRVVVHRDVSPVYRVGHLDRVASIRRALADSLPGVSIAGSSYDGVGIPDCIASGRRAAAEALER